MSSTYFSLQSSSNTIELKVEDLEKADVIRINKDRYHIIVNNNSYTIDIQEIDLKNKLVSGIINDRHFSFKIQDELEKKIQQLGLLTGGKKKEDKIIAPMPGLVLKILVSEGQSVQKGEALLVLEAMKMENVIKAGHDGTIKTLHVQQGDKVEKSQSLISF